LFEVRPRFDNQNDGSSTGFPIRGEPKDLGALLSSP
jgi:hypothetical protein